MRRMSRGWCAAGKNEPMWMSQLPAHAAQRRLQVAGGVATNRSPGGSVSSSFAGASSDLSLKKSFPGNLIALLGCSNVRRSSIVPALAPLLVSQQRGRCRSCRDAIRAATRDVQRAAVVVAPMRDCPVMPSFECGGALGCRPLRPRRLSSRARWTAHSPPRATQPADEPRSARADTRTCMESQRASTRTPPKPTVESLTQRGSEQEKQTKTG